MNFTEIKDLNIYIEDFIKEDIGEGDHTTLSTIPINQRGVATLLIKEKGVIAGITTSSLVLNQVDSELEVKYFLKDGDRVKPGDAVFEVEGRLHSILMAERLVLNLLQRMSGIATMTRRVVDILSDTDTKVLDTRKTTPGLRVFEKEAVRIGGGENHRFGLYDMILIKDNHVDYAGGIEAALSKAHSYRDENNLNIEIEIEVRNLDELHQVLSFGKADRILLDNFEFNDLREAVKLIDGRMITEASGGITVETVHTYAATGVDYISMGALTHSVKSLDMSLKAVGISAG